MYSTDKPIKKYREYIYYRVPLPNYIISNIPKNMNFTIYLLYSSGNSFHTGSRARLAFG